MLKKNKNYWNERFRAMETAQHERSAQKAEEIRKIFDHSIADIEKKIAHWYYRVAENNEVSMAKAMQMVSKRDLEEFRWTAEEYIKHGQENAKNQRWMKELENASARVHIGWLEMLKYEIRAEAEKLFDDYTNEIDSHIMDTYMKDYYHTAYEIQKGFEVGSSLQRLDKRMVEKVINRPWAVDGRNFSERIWDDRTKLVNTLHKSLSVMCITGAAPDQAISEIAKVMGVSRNRAGTLVMTESAAFANKARQECMKELDAKEFEVVETLDTITCSYCQEMDEKHFPMDQFEIGVTAPPFHPNCRGCTCPYFDDEFTEGGERAARGEDGKTYYVPADMTYKEWKKTFVHDDNTKLEDSSRASVASSKDKTKVANTKTSDIMKLPRYDEAVIPEEKFTKYALDYNKDADKARAFKAALGYDQSNYKELIDNIRRNLSLFDAKKKGDNGYGMRYEVIMELKGANGKKAKVLTAWIDDEKTGEMRMVSAYIDKE